MGPLGLLMFFGGLGMLIGMLVGPSGPGVVLGITVVGAGAALVARTIVRDNGSSTD